MSQLQFKPGQFHKLRATTTVHLGPIGRDLVKDTEVEFDGFTLKMGGETHSMPSLKGGVLGGWLVPIADTLATYQAKPAGIEVHAADSNKRDAQQNNFAVVTAEERVVGRKLGDPTKLGTPQAHPNTRNIRQAAAAPQQTQQQTQSAPIQRGRKTLASGQVVPAWVDESTLPPWPRRRDFKSEPDFVLAANDYNNAVINQIAYNQPIVKPDSFGGDRHNSSGDEGRPVGKDGKYRVVATGGQQGEIIGQIKTSSKSAPTGYEGDPKLKEYTFNNKRPPPAVNMASGEPAGTLIKDHGAIRNLQASVGSGPQWETPTVTVGNTPQAALIDDGVDPAHLRQPHTDGLTVTLSSGPELAEMMPDAVMTPAPTPGAVLNIRPKKSQEEVIAEVVGSWDKDRHWRDRVAEAVDFYADSPAIIDAICGIETAGIVKRIRSEVAKG